MWRGGNVLDDEVFSKGVNLLLEGLVPVRCSNEKPSLDALYEPEIRSVTIPGDLTLL